jgi:septal ring factor EnvC (AmiA/AmiB activator)
MSPLPTPGLRLLALGGVLLAILVPLPAVLAATEEQETRDQLEQLKRNMAALSQELELDMQQRGSVQSALRESEIAIGKTRKGIEDTRLRLQSTATRLTDLRQQRQQLLIARGEQQELIVREIQTAYQMGKQGQLKVLLNQEQPGTLARSMAYYDYFYQARLGHIDRYLGIIARIDTLEPEIASTATQLEVSRETLRTQEQQLIAGKAQRQVDLNRLNTRIASKDQRLKKLDQDREELERLLEVIEQAVAEMDLPQEYQNFASLKGQMPWPMGGKPSNRFGGSRGSGKRRWQGLTIPAQEGGNVNAIHHGRVVFADWFRGSGLLLIIDHGDGYMSLYAHNQALLRDVGEWVSAGAAIASAGNSGGRQNAALYFEIRENGKPVNPTSWLKSG